MKMSDIRFYVPDNLTIPTDLALYVEDTYVKYERIADGFRFHIFEDDEEKAMKIAESIIMTMTFEHDESSHGVSWRTISVKVVEQEECYRVDTVIDWIYRVRDSY